MKLIKSNNTFLLVQTITDQILLIVDGTISKPVLKVWHVSQKQKAINYFYSVTSQSYLKHMKHPQHRVPTAQAIKIENKKSFFAMILFIILFLGASYYAPEHIDGYTPPPVQTK